MRWIDTDLGELCHLYQPTTISKKDMVDDGKYLVYGANGVIGRYDKYNHETPQLLITCRGATCGAVNTTEGKVWINGNAMVVAPKDERISLKFLEYLFRGGIDVQGIVSGAAQPQITRQGLSPVRFKYPASLEEQKRIVAILDEVFADIEQVRAKTEQNLKNARELFESYLDQVAGEKKPLGEFVSIKTGKLNANAAVEGGQFPFFTCSREIFAIDRFSFDCEAILLAGNNASGDFNVKHYKGKFDAYQRTYVITITDENKLLYPFLYYQMIKSLKELKEGSVGAGTKFLKIGMIQNLKISIPSLAEQKKILSTLLVLKEELDRLEEVYEEKLECLDELKQSILQKAFSGELTQKENQGAVA